MTKKLWYMLLLSFFYTISVYFKYRNQSSFVYRQFVNINSMRFNIASFSYNPSILVRYRLGYVNLFSKNSTTITSSPNNSAMASSNSVTNDILNNNGPSENVIRKFFADRKGITNLFQYANSLQYDTALKPTEALPVYNVDRSFVRQARRKWKTNRRRNWLCDWRVFPKDKEISPTSVTPPKNKPVLAMAITTDAKRIGRPLQNTLAMMNLYQQQYSFRGVVFTTSSRVIDICKKYNLTVITDMQRNEYGLPIVSYMFQRMVVSVDASYYGYMNSDILFPPDVFTILSVTYGKMKAGIVSKNVGLIGSVRDSSISFESKDFSSVKKLNRVFKVGTQGLLRDKRCIDIFIYPSTFQFSHIPPVVVGRKYVDSVLFQVPEYDDGYNIDMSQYCTFIHQGSDNYISHGYYNQTLANRLYNLRYVFFPVSDIFHSRFLIKRDYHLWECEPTPIKDLIFSVV